MKCAAERQPVIDGARLGMRMRLGAAGALEKTAEIKWRCERDETEAGASVNCFPPGKAEAAPLVPVPDSLDFLPLLVVCFPNHVLPNSKQPEVPTTSCRGQRSHTHSLSRQSLTLCSGSTLMGIFTNIPIREAQLSALE